ncbi:thermonuclease family protein [Phenylobacterium ferrooxidans]|uniref:Thermonuclease family protein n=1 Tax=Phenylobacterium ferrooxidans TaxID=2982689 RepID=A0ABW6CP06_9CAUL
MALVVVILFSVEPGASVARPSMQWSGQVVGISDGDTITVLTDNKQPIKVRLTEIDAPEKRQPWGAKSKQLLSDLVYSKRVRVQENGQDRYGRTLGRVYLGDLDVSAEMIRRGGAWAYRKYLTDPSLLVVEGRAKAAKRGLWSLPEGQRQPPWEWRRRGRMSGQSGGPDATRMAQARRGAPANEIRAA